MSGASGAALGGAAAGLGLLLLAAELLPARPDLASALARLDAARTQQPPSATAAPSAGLTFASGGWSGMRGLPAAVGGWLAGRLAGPGGRLAVPAADLRVLERTPAWLFTRKAAAALAGLTVPAALLTVFAVLGVRLPIVLPMAVSLAAGVGGFLLPDLLLRTEAAEARAGFRRAVGAYLDLVALERAADGGPGEALHRAAAVGHGPAFTQIADALERARLSGTTPWQGLAHLAEQIGVTELKDLADIIALAGDDGAAVYDTLLAKAAGLRARALRETEADANAASERMTLPGVLLGFGFIVLVCYPALARVLG